MVADGTTFEQICRDLPDLEPEDVAEALRCAAGRGSCPPPAASAMALLVDDNTPVPLAALLAVPAGWGVVHVRELRLKPAPQTEVLASAELDRRVVVSADTVFGTLLAASGGWPIDRPVEDRICPPGRTRGSAVDREPASTGRRPSRGVIAMTDQRIPVGDLPIG